MSLIQVKNLSFTYEDSFDPVFENVSFQIDTDWKLGFIGRNGKGKTTFLKLLTGEYEYSGSILSSVDFEYFPYQVENKEQLTYEIAGSVNPAMEHWELLRELNLLNADAEILYRPFCSLSFGEQSKVLLASLFLKEHAFLLIDEPTNHLDAAARDKIADYLAHKKGFILVSHDRDFLDRCTDHVLVLNRRSIEVRKGSFSSWYEDKLSRDESEIRQNARLKKDIRKLKDAARQAARWSDKTEASKIGNHVGDRGFVGHQAAKMMKRSKMLERRRENAVQEKEHLLKDIESTESLKINMLHYHSNRLVTIKDLSIRYPDSDTPLFSGLSMQICSGSRIALSGKNGCGKSSLIRLILGENIPHTGEISVAAGLRISYVSQDTSHLHGTLAEFALHCGVDAPLLLTVLDKLGLERQQFEKKIETYSEGQKKKVLLAKSLCEPAHLFVWDEPLNYIDIFSRIQLEDLLLACQPTMLFVEHDRTFREKIATEIIEL